MVNEVQMILAGVLMAAAVVAALVLVPSRLRRWIVHVDQWIPGDFSAIATWLAWVGTALVAGLFLFGGSLALANGGGADTSGIIDELRSFGAGTGVWLLEHLTRILVIVGLAALIAQVIKRATPSVVKEHLGTRMGPDNRPDESPGELQKRSDTLTNVVVHAFAWVVYVMAGFMILLELGFNLAPLLAAAGVAGIAIGFGAQSLVKDVLAGLFILWEDQYRVGDVVMLAGVGGLVEDINLRRTTLRDLQFVVHVIPNGEIRVASNMTKQKSRFVEDVGVAYRTDLDHAIRVINEVGQEMQDDPEWGSIINDQIRVLRVDAFADSAINIRVLGETLPLRQWDVAGQFRQRVKRRFDEEGIEIPFPHQTVYWGIDQPPFHADGQQHGQPAEAAPPKEVRHEAAGRPPFDRTKALPGEDDAGGS